MNISCTNTTACANLSQVTTAQIIIETKTLVTYIASGSVRVSQGQFDECFNENTANVYLGIGYIYYQFSPQTNCGNYIFSNNVMLPIQSAAVYLKYGDGSVTYH